MATYNVSVTQSSIIFPDNLTSGSTSTFSIENNGPASSYFTLETIPPYSTSTPKNTSGSFTLGTGISGLQTGDYFIGVVVAPGGGTFSFTNAGPVVGSTLLMKGMGSSVLTSNITLDPDAQAFITAAGITDATQQSAINTLVVDLKNYGIWSKMKAIYPFVGGTSSTHKWNLKDPRDLDAAFRLVFSGGWTHSSTGALPNGTNGYADTFLIPNTSLTASSTHLSYYSRTNVTNNTGLEFGAWQTSYAYGIEFAIYRNVPNKTYAIINTTGGGGLILASATTPTTGFYIINRTANNIGKIFKNNITIATNTGSYTTTTTTSKLYLAASNDFGTAAAFANKQCAFASIGDGLTDTEAANLYTAVQAYQTTLSRNV